MRYGLFYLQNSIMAFVPSSEVLFWSYILREKSLGCLLEPFSRVEVHMEMDMDWKWMEMRHNLGKCYGLVWIWGKAISLKRYNRYGAFIKHDIRNTEARFYP